MTQITRPLAICLLAYASGCGSSEIESLQGGWSGQILCLGETSDLSLGILVEQGAIRGNGQIRTKGSNADFSLHGEQKTVKRLLECQDPLCEGESDCSSRLDKNGEGGKSTCRQNLCTPCYEYRDQPQVAIVLRDANVTIPDPELELWRFGTNRLEGTIRGFCPDEDKQPPQVKLEKD
jgi:hypothetical protein